ncbi:PAS domain S-box protein [Bacteriovorax sp. DB6_IX]|nr:PAS domain S-box protein [Bacteriovorax sp. DB6_IX]EQC43153.1 PAS domain S-box protein [Bacteriovorax sp. DB6_IX]
MDIKNSHNLVFSEEDFSGILKALSRVQAVIVFDLEGNILTANENFLGALGYQLSEIKGKHHRIFCEYSYSSTPEYVEFWKRLARGEFEAGEYKRLSKEGKEVWINASYNPIFDDEGNIKRIVKFATDITASKLKNADFEGKIKAISKAQAMIEFELDGTIIDANENFLSAMGYQLEEIKGKHHRIFCDPTYVTSSEYQKFWNKLGNGDFEAGEYKRFSKNGDEIWINASYNPILDASGKPFKVVKFATDITETKIKNADFEGQLNAIDKSQAVIEFTPDGTILKANKNFLATVGYSIDEIKGQHHRIFCEPEYTRSSDYRDFWIKLANGEFDTGEYKRIGKGGKEVWINASYNPIYNHNGEVYKVVKYATDLTKEKEAYNNLVETFENAAIELLASSSQISSVAEEMTADAKITLEVSTNASASSRQVASGVQNVSTSTEELSASITELAKSSSEASKCSSEAKEMTLEASENISELGKASEDIGNVIKVISSMLSRQIYSL